MAKPDWRPPARVVDAKAGDAKVASEGVCRACGRPGGHPIYGLNNAHLVAKGQRGDDVVANIIPLGGSGTVGCHGIQTSHNDGSNCKGEWVTWDWVAHRIRASLRPDERTYILTKTGQDWLDRNFPEGDV